MAVKKRGLGKGLDALLGTRTAVDTEAASGGELRHIPVDLLQRSAFQPRGHFPQEALQELADSIRAQGVIQPIVARPLPGGRKYEIIAGERRWRAAQLAGLQEIPAVIRDIDDQATMCLALIENIQREDLNPLEQARALQRLLDEFDMTHEAVAAAVGRSRSTVTNLLRLLELDAKVKAMVEAGELEMGHARALLALPAARQAEAAGQVARRGLSVRATEDLVRRMQPGPGRNSTSQPARPGTGGTADPDIRRLQQELSDRLGSQTTISCDSKGRGTLSIRFHSLDELDGVLRRIR